MTLAVVSVIVMIIIFSISHTLKGKGLSDWFEKYYMPIIIGFYILIFLTILLLEYMYKI